MNTHVPRGAAWFEALYADAGSAGHNPDDEVFVLAGDLLRTGLAPADVRAAVFEVLRTVPGVTLTQEVVIDGHRGAAFARDSWVASQGSAPEVIGHRELIIDITTGTYLGERDGDADGKPMFTSSAWRVAVDSVPADVLRQGRANEMVCDENYSCQPK